MKILIVIIGFIVCISIDEAYAENCEVLNTVYKKINSKKYLNQYDYEVDSAHLKTILSSFILALDPQKLYFHQSDVKYFLSSQNRLKKIDQMTDSTHNVGEMMCDYVMLIGSKLKLRIKEIEPYFGDIIHYIDTTPKASFSSTKMFVDGFCREYVSNVYEKKKRWESFFLYERLKLYFYSSSRSLRFMKQIAMNYSEVLKDSSYWYMLFVDVYLRHFDPRARFLLKENPLKQRVLSRQGYRYNTEGVDFKRPTNFARLNSPHRGYQDYFYIENIYQRRFYMSVPQMGFFTVMDRIVNFFDLIVEDPYHFILRRFKNSYHWDKVINTSVGQRVDGVSFRFFKRLFAPLTEKSGARVTVEYLHGESLKYFLEPVSFDHTQDVKMHQLLLRYKEDVAWILDLRGVRLENVRIAVHFLSLFFPTGMSLFQMNREGEVPQNVVARNVGQGRLSLPMVVLVDRQTSFVAELIAAVLQEQGKALVVAEGIGVKTAGVGMVIRRITIDDDKGIYLVKSNKLLYTPQGKVLEGVGVMADFTLPMRNDVYPRAWSRHKVWGPSREKVFASIAPVPGYDPRPLAKSLIEYLKKRSYERLIKRRYPVDVWQQRVHNVSAMHISPTLYASDLTDSLSFEEAYEMDVQALFDEEQTYGAYDQCVQLSLSEEDFRQDIERSKRRNGLLKIGLRDYERYFNGEKLNIYLKIILEDAALAEAFFIASDFYFLAHKKSPLDMLFHHHGP